MSKPMTSRGELKGLDLAVPWLLASGQPDPRPDRTDLPGRAIVPGIQLYVQEAGDVVKLDMDLHEAGDLYAALEQHMENVAEAQPITQEERDRLLRKDRIRKGNLEAVRDEIARPLFPKGDPAEDVRRLWIDGPTRYGKVYTAPGDAHDVVRSWFPELAEALDRLANQ
jgi:hypothetical protein